MPVLSQGEFPNIYAIMFGPLICMLSGAAFLTRIEVPKIMISVLPFLKFKESSLPVSQL